MKSPTDVALKEKLFAEDLRNLCITIKNMIANGESISEDYNINMMKILNNIFDEFVCNKVLFTNNTDKMFFAIKVDPTIVDTDVAKIVLGTDEVQLTRYAVEIDTKIFQIVDATAVSCYLIEEIASIMDPNTIENVRNTLDLILTGTDDSIEIKSSLYYSQILTFGIKDTIEKVASLIYKPEEAVGNNIYSQVFQIKDILLDTLGKIKIGVFGQHDITGSPKLGILQWVLNTYRDIDTNCNAISDILKTAKMSTGSVLVQKEIDLTLKSINRAESEVVSEAAPLLEAFKGFSIFKGLKQSGLRSIEDDLYEYKIRVKNCEEQDEAMYILRQINTRINILEDYIYNTPNLSEQEISRWRSVIDDFRALRIELSKKKVSNKPQYGIFVDYNKLDELDKDTAY